MEAVPRMPMIWLELKEAGEFQFSSTVRQKNIPSLLFQYIQINFGENPENYSEALKKLEQLRQNVVNIPRDFEGCNTLRKYCGQLHFLQSRVPMAASQEAAVPVTWIDAFSGRNITHEDINYEQACVLFNLGALHSLLGAMDNRLSEEGMKVSCTHFQCSAGAFAHLRDHFNHSYSSDMSSQALSINISLMLAQAQECLLEKTLLDNRKSHLIAKICAQVCDYYKDCLRVLDNSDCVPGRIQKEWRKLVSMKISYFSAITHLHMGKQSEEQQKFGEAVAYFQSSLDKLNDAIKQSKSQSVQDALKFTMDVIGGKYNSAKKDNDFIYHESVPGLDTLAAVKGASLVKPLPVNLTDQSVTGPDLFSKLVPMATHEASSLYSEEKAKLLRDIVAKIEDKNQILEKFMESLSSDSVYKIDMFKSLPDALLEKCAFLSVRPDTVKNLVQAMQDEMSSLQKMKTILGKVDEMRKQRISLESQLRDLIHKDDITGVLVTTDRSEMKTLFEEQLKKYDQLKGYIEQNLVAQDNILKALTEANVQYAPVRKTLTFKEQQWNSTVQALIASFEAYEDLMKKAEEGKDFYLDLDKKTSALLDKTKSYCQTREGERVTLLEKEIGKVPPPRPAAQKPVIGQKVISGPSSVEDLPQELQSLPPNLNLPRGPVLSSSVPHSGPPVSWPQRASPFPPTQFPNPQFPTADPKLRQQLAHHLPQAPYGQPSAPMQIPGTPPQQFQVRPHPQVNQLTNPQVPAQGYNPALWQQPHGGPVATGGYSVPPQMGQIPQNSIRPGLPGQPQVSLANSFGQQMPTGMPQSSSVQQIIQGTPSQSFTNQPRQSIPSATPRSAFPGQILPPFPPGQVQPPMPGQTHQQPGLPSGYRPALLPHTQPQFGPPGQLTVSHPQGALIPGQAQAQPQSTQFHPGQLPQNRPQPNIGYAPTSFPSSQPQQIPPPHQVHPGSQMFPQAPLSQNSQVSFGPRPLSQPGAVPPQSNIYSFAATHMAQQPMGQQTIPSQFNTMFNGAGGQPMCPPGQNQILGHQNVAHPSSGQAVAPVMDNPVPLSLGSTLIPTPSPIQVSSQNQISAASNATPTGSTTILGSLQNKVDNLSIQS
ncbi:tyrosine- phosphatase non-receptor type 23-like protein [Labeo rohita]|uniref:Tyrosine-phosphatase non-receptor type 23-like protein n=1 Tax=Labeo rohita TaxID=84645 RepID=A0A498N2D3_LABRO|nr:tyrosine- phosphatase non-receptor type 23-like protein [Labeo rohita]